MTLEREIVKRILANVGVVPGPGFGKAGLTLLDFKLDKEFLVHYEDGHQQKFPLWSGYGTLSNSKIRALLIDLTYDEMPEYALALRVDDKPIYALNITYDDDESCLFLLQEDTRWIIPSMLIKVWALLGTEMIADQGMSWQPSNNYDDLYQAVLHITEM